MTASLTREVRDRAVAALRRAHTAGRRKAEGTPIDLFGGVCSCVIIAEEFDIPVPERGDPVAEQAMYHAVIALGFPRAGRVSMPVPTVAAVNDATVAAVNDATAERGTRRARTFDEVADVLARWDVIDAAEQICRDAVAVPA